MKYKDLDEMTIFFPSIPKIVLLIVFCIFQVAPQKNTSLITIPKYFMAHFRVSSLKYFRGFLTGNCLLKIKL